MNIELTKLLFTIPGYTFTTGLVIISVSIIILIIKLHATPNLLKRYNDLIGLNLLVLDTKGNIIFISDRLYKSLGYNIISIKGIKRIAQIFENEDAIKLAFSNKNIELYEEITINLIDCNKKPLRAHLQKKRISSFGKKYHVLNFNINNNQREFERYKNLVELLPNMIFESTLEGYLTFANQACLNAFELTYVDVKEGVNFRDLLVDEEIPRLEEMLRTRRLRSGMHGIEFLAKSKKGKKFNILIYIDYVLTKKKITGLRGVAIDISEQKQKEDELKNTYNLTLNIIRNAPFGIMVFNNEGKIRLVNQLCSVYLDEKIDSLMYKNIHDTKALSNKDLKEFVALLIESESNRTISKQIKAVLDDDSAGWLNCIGIPYITATKQQNFLVIFQDITQQFEYHDELIRLNMELSSQNIEFLAQKDELANLNKLLRRKQKDLKEKSEELSLLINNIVIQVWYLRDKSTYGAVNHAHAMFLGKEEDEIAHKKISDVRDISEYSKLIEINKQVYERKEPVKVEEWFINAENEPRLLSVNLTPKLNLHDEIEFVVCSAIDVTEQTMLANSLAEAKEEADKANALKSIFLANMSHEIRTPMNAILGYTNVLAKTITDIKKRDYIDIIKKNGENLLLLINDILDLSKIEAGKLNIEYKPTSLKVLFKDIKSIFSLKALEKNIELRTKVNINDSTLFLLDETRLRQVLFNLTGNAVKFTHQGHVNIKAYMPEYNNSQTNTTDIIIEIEDTGIGIAEKELNSIFEAFQQQKNQSNKYGGTGLGLAISKRLVEMMNGRISVESEKNIGSVFKVVLHNVEIADYSESMHEIQNTIFSPIFKNQTILIAEDNLHNQQLIETLLSERNLNFVKANTGKEVLEILRKSEVDLILLDIKMPDMDGIEALQHIRNNPKTKDIPIIVVTAEVINNNEKMLRKQGCDGFIAKPVDENKLLHKLAKFLNFEEDINSTQHFIKDTNNITNLLQDIEANPDEFKELIIKALPLWKKSAVSMQLDAWLAFAKELINLGNNKLEIVAVGKHLIDIIESFNIKKLKEFRTKFQVLLTKIDLNINTDDT